MNILDEPKIKQPLSEDEKRKKREITNKKARKRYRDKVVLNPTKIRRYTKHEKQIRNKINKRQTLLQPEQSHITKKGENKIPPKNER